MDHDAIAMFQLTFDVDDVSIVRERHYRLTEANDIREEDLATYRTPRARLNSLGRRICNGQR